MAQTVNVLQALVLTEGPKLCLTPTYWVYDFLKPHRGGELAGTTVRGPSLALADGRTLALCSASATVKGRGLALSLVNADLAAAHRVVVSLSDASAAGVTST
jgi:alpha-N-arabinofuranosidase